MKKSVFYFLHAILVLFFVLMAISNLRSTSLYYHEPFSSSIRDSLLIWGSFLALVYLNYWIFIPKFLISREYLKFVLVIMVIVLGFSIYLNSIIFLLADVLKVKTHLFDNGWMFKLSAGWAVIFSLIGTFFRLFIDWFRKSQDKIQLEKHNLKSELSMLKNQLNPHFLFNSLNNIDYLINENSPDASLALNKLSEMMRYMVYDSEKELVPLIDEIIYIENYITIQKLRIQNESRIELNIAGNAENKQIAPMLFIPFVENAFKHSPLKDKPDNKIKVKIDIQDNHLSFHCSNTVSEINKDNSSGIGLENVRKRLELIYKANYSLNIKNSDRRFSVDLDIKL